MRDFHKPIVDAIEDMNDSFIMLDSKWRYIYVNRNAEKLLKHKKEKLIGKNILAFPILRRSLFYSKAKEAVKTKKPISFENYSKLLSKWMEVRLYPLSDILSCYFTDISPRKRAEFRQEFISKINSTIALSLDYNKALRNAAKVINNYLADYCRIVILDENNQIKETIINHNNPKKIPLVEKLYKDVSESKYGLEQLLTKGKPEITSIIDDKFFEKYSEKPELVKIIKQLDPKSYMGVPLIAKGRIVGAITLSSTKPNREYSEDDLALVGGVASRLALALENMRLFEKVQQERERLEFGQSAGKIGTFEWNIENNKSTWTLAFSALFGNPPEANEGTIEKWLDMVHPDDKEMVKKEGEEAIKSGNRLNIKFRIIWPDKTMRYLSVKARIFRNRDNQPMRMVGVAIDITHRKKIENELRFLAEASKVLSSSLNYKATLNSVAKLAVPDMADWCAVDMFEKNGKTVRVTTAHNTPPGLAKVVKTARPKLYPIANQELLYSAMIVPIVHGKKAIGAITFANTKESKRVFNQDDLSIAEKIADRAALVIENTLLYQKSQQATKMREAFISIASHELKTPITSLKVYTQVLRQQAEKQGDENLSHYLFKMDQQVEKLNKLIKDLLDASRMQLGKLSFRKSYFDLDELVKEVVGAIQLTTNHIIIIKGKIGKVYGDKDRIGQVIINLLINAIKYSPEANKVIVNLMNQDDKAVVNIKDYGVGIDKENQQKIFERFYQVNGASNGINSGLGIGLYISTEIVKRHGGNIWVESAKGKGSTFSFAIPSRTN